MIQGFSDCSVQADILRWIVFRLAIDLAALFLLAISAPLQAQSNECGTFCILECPQRVNSQSFLETSATDLTHGGVDGKISSVLDGSFRAATQSTAAGMGSGLVTSAERCSTTTAPEAENSSDKAAPNGAVHIRRPPDFNDNVYYRNRLEFSLDGGWLPINIPFVFDVFLGDGYTMTDLRYTLVPIIASLRWQMDDVGGPWIFRGNWELEASGAITLIPRGPETRYFAWIMGVRRNFVPHHGRFAPYFDGRVGLGNIDAKEPDGVLYAQGADFTFTVNMGSGVRYNFNPRYSISAGLNWMHISNLYLSEPKFANYGINVYGPMFGIDVRLGKLRHRGSE